MVKIKNKGDGEMRILEKVLDKDWQKLWCDESRGLTLFCLYYKQEIKGSKCPETCYYAKGRGAK